MKRRIFFLLRFWRINDYCELKTFVVSAIVQEDQDSNQVATTMLPLICLNFKVEGWIIESDERR